VPRASAAASRLNEQIIQNKITIWDSDEVFKSCCIGDIMRRER